MRITILLVLRALEHLETRVAKLTEGLARNGSHCKECPSRKDGFSRIKSGDNRPSKPIIDMADSVVVVLKSKCRVVVFSP